MFKSANNPQNYGLVAVLYSVTRYFKQWRWKERASSSILQPLYQADPVRSKQKFIDTRFLVVDCEMTGLNPNADSLLSVGWVEINRGAIDLATAYHSLIYSDQSVEQSAHIHGLQDTQVAGAASVAKALSHLVRQMPNKVLVFHHAPLDISFLQRSAKQLFGAPLLFPYLDTLAMEKRRLKLSNQAASLQLGDVRDRFGLPRTLQHNALSDARATAELFLALCAHSGGSEKLTLGDLGLNCS